MIDEIEKARDIGLLVFINSSGSLICKHAKRDERTDRFKSSPCKREFAKSIAGKYLDHAPCRNWFKENYIVKDYSSFDEGMNKSGYYFEWEQNVINNVLTTDKAARG